MKKKICFLVSFCILLFILIFVFFSLYNDKAIISLKISQFDVFDTFKLSDIIEIQNGKLYKDYDIDTSVIGNRKIKIEYKNKYNFKKNTELEINVVDNVKPYVDINSSYNYVIGSQVDILDKILCVDNYTKDVDCRIEGDYDLEKVGKYKVKFIAEDESLNTSSYDFYINVIEKGSTSSQNNKETSISFSDIKEKYGDNTYMIDVSKWQGDIDFKKVKEQGINYVMIRVGHGNLNNTEMILDPYFIQNITGFLNENIEVGIYYYSYAKTLEWANKEANWVLNIIKDYNVTLPVVFDFECFNYINSMNISLHDMEEIKNEFLKVFENNGYKTLLYGSKHYLNNLWIYNKHDIWLAHYTSKTDYSGKYLFWQFSDKVRLPGIDNNVDMNIIMNNW